MSRTVAYWFATHDDQAIPDRVKIRVFLRADGKCAKCTRKVTPGDKWQCDHVIALINGGTHSEGNLQVLCDWCHKNKTRQDVKEKSRTARIRARHLGIRKKTKFKGWRKMNGDIVFAPRQS